MDGLHFQTAAPPTRSDPARADIACFVGFVACRQAGAVQRAELERALRALGWSGPPLPAAARVLPEQVLPSGDSANAFASWLVGLGWTPTTSAVAAADLFRRAAGAVVGEPLVEWWVENAWTSPFSMRSAADLLELADVPVPVDTWDVFDALFAWEQRPLVAGTARVADTTLGAAVRRFFLHGGRKCYVVRAGDPWSLFAPLSVRAAVRERLLRTPPSPTPVDRATWRGVAHLFGLPDVSLLCTPDLPELFSVDAGAIAPENEIEVEERFIECATRTTAEPSRGLRAFPVPRCNAEGFPAWAAFVRAIGLLVSDKSPEVQFVAALPLSVTETMLRADPAVVGLPAVQRAHAVAVRAFASRTAQWDAARTIQTAFVQLVYPWLQTRESVRLPGGVEPPDAMLAGLIANNALTRGTWRSVAREPVFGLLDLEPILSIEDLERELPFQGAEGSRRLPRTVRERISMFTPTPTGFHLLSDVTTDDDESYRPANVNRLVASIVRAARIAGEDIVFANNGEGLWRRVRAALEELLLGLWGEGALTGAFSAEAFDVRCDRSTMTQADLDAGRLIAQVQFNAANPIEQITVAFAMDEGGHVTLIPARAGAAA
jgi:Bacteriophage tail sheath protein